MRKSDGLAWTFLLVVAVVVTHKFAWFKDQYVWAYTWMQTHPEIVVPTVVAAVLGRLFGWGSTVRKYRSLFKERVAIVGTLRDTQTSLARVNGQLRELQQEHQALVQERTNVPAPQPEAAKRSRRLRLPPMEAIQAPQGSRSWQERLLTEDGFDQPEEKPGS